MYKQVEEIMATLAGQTLPPMKHMLEAHLGSGGKRVRSNLLIESVVAMDGVAGIANGAAAAVELFHNATLVHDDIQDGDRLRRGVPALWVSVGVNQAINAGDMMLMMPVSAIATSKISDEKKWKLSESFARAAQNVVIGQSLEPELINNLAGGDVYEKYMTCIKGKTAALFEFVAEAAAILTEKTHLAAELRGSFQSLGILFQIQDDILDLYGDKGRGTCGQDLREKKISILVAQHLRRAGSPQDLIGFLKSPREKTSDGDVQLWIQKFRDEGALERSGELIRKLSQEIRASSWGQTEPGLQALLNATVTRILEPIRSVL